MSNNNNKIIVAIEGIDGAGKTTLIKILQNELKCGLYQRTRKCTVINRMVSTKFMKNNYMLQAPIYCFLSRVNYLRFLRSKSSSAIILMDRCFLSNICYFAPEAIHDKKKLNRWMKKEIGMMPEKIFVLDVAPQIAHLRDNMCKPMDWLVNAREAYLDAASPTSLIQQISNVEVIKEHLSIDEKLLIIKQYIKAEEKRNGTR